tara:strand:+ start:453 stop:1640 length:1188 start_codon:yes stop_codon:yes gene_type:complete
MSLINQTNEEYYAGEKIVAVTAAPQTVFTSTFEVKLQVESPTAPANFDLKVSTDGGNTFNNYAGNIVSVVNNNATTPPYNTQTITVNPAVPATANTLFRIGLKATALWNNYGSYKYIKLNDIVNNFLIAYTGVGKLIPMVKRTDVIFHAKRGLQEFSYDTLNSIKAMELDLPASMSVIIPQDYVNYVRMSFVDELGVLHPIYPANNLTTDPTSVPLQNNDGTFIQDKYGENTEADQSITRTRWKDANDRLINGAYQEYYYNANVYNFSWRKETYGRRYGLDPVTSQSNGWFNIDKRKNLISFSSDLKDRLIILEYISDGLASDLDTKLPKMAEEAMYMHIAYSILAGRSGVPEYVVQRFKRDRSAQLRNAKIRLSNMKLGEMTQTMRGKSKWIKH